MAAYTDRERAILGPLTTTFTPPAPCTIAVGQCSTCNVAWWGQTCAPTTVQDNPSCWPTTTKGAPAASSALFGWGFYSPGLECPAGYTSACTAIADKTSQWKVQYQMEAEETFVGCCPTGFSCDNQNGQTCNMAVRSTTIPTVSCQDGSSNNFGFTTLPNSAVRSIWLFAPMIQLAWKSTDRSTTTAMSSSTLSATSAPSTSLAAPTSTPNTDSFPTSNSGLSTGAVAGISVGAAILFLLVLFATVFIWRRRRAARRDQSLPLSNIGGSQQPAYRDRGFEGAAEAHKQYYVGGMAEAPATTEVYEAPGHSQERVEVPREGHGRNGAAVEMPSERYR
ncbi:hypothetical protein VTI74DRAFT_2626 [Chaetomium olivicolor]